MLLLTEDLGATGYAPSRDGFSKAQLHAVVDTLVCLHARFWENLQADTLDVAHPEPSLTQSAQAWPDQVICANAEAARRGVAEFVETYQTEITARDRALLDELLACWEDRFLARTADAAAITLIHGDFHLLGNLFLRPLRPSAEVRLIGPSSSQGSVRTISPTA